MGGGGTAFREEQVSHRAGKRSRAGYTAGERLANLEEWRRTGQHPEKVRAEAAPRPPPPFDERNARVFLALGAAAAAERRDLGRVVVEVFEDVGPPASAFMAMCAAPGRAAPSLSRARIHTVVPGSFMQMGAAARGAAEAGRPARGIREGALRQFAHSEAGLVSVAGGGGAVEVIVTLADEGVRAFDSGESVVVGRVVDEEGMAVLRAAERFFEEHRAARLSIDDCGRAGAMSSAEARASGGPEAPAAAAPAAAIDVTASVKDALEKRAAAAKAAHVGGAGDGRASGVKRMWDDLVGDEGDESDDDESDGGA